MSLGRVAGQLVTFALWTLRLERFGALRNYGQARRTTDNQIAYAEWIAAFDYDPERDRSRYEARLDALKRRPLISVLMPVHETPAEHLEAAITSVLGQIYPHWELCIADDASSAPHVRRILDRYRSADARLKVIYRPAHGHISEATNSAFALARGQYVAMLDHDDILREHALAEVAFALAAHPDARLVFSDEDKIDDGSRRSAPYFKPDFSPDLLLAQNYLNHLTVYRAEAVREVGGWRKGFEGAQDHDLNLRLVHGSDPSGIVHIPKILYHWRTARGSTATGTVAKGYAQQAGLRAVADHLGRTRPGARVEPGREWPLYRVIDPLPDPAPLVSLIVATATGGALPEACLRAILSKTTYPRFEILVVHSGSSDGRLLNLSRMAPGPAVRVVRFPGRFALEAMANFAATQANGSVLGLVGEGTEVIGGEWLSEMVAQACRPEIGCVGAMLYSRRETVRHAGLILGAGTIASSAHRHAARGQPGYFGRLACAQNVSALSAACLLVRREVFHAAGGLDEALGGAFADVDLCLKVRRLGFLNLWTPFAELYDDEPAARGLTMSARQGRGHMGGVRKLVERWGPELACDSYYSPNFSPARADFTFRTTADPDPAARFASDAR